jgi:Rrf2 family transcriptional regulator, nitric oxide-sensitive transcriptional repressor
MRLTKHTDFSLRVLIYLSLQPLDQLVNNNEISKHFDIPKNHLIKVVHKLSKLGYLYTKRGKNGGIKLAKLPEEIQISKVVMDIEPITQLVNCHKPKCPLLPGCGLIPLLEQARASFFEVLSFHTLADLTKKPKALKHLIKLLPTAVNE